MRAYLLISLLLGLVALSAGQDRAVRGRIRNLIRAAKGGDLEAKQTLRSLRERLIRNRSEKSRTQSVAIPSIPEQPETQIISRPPPPPATQRQEPATQRQSPAPQRQSPAPRRQSPAPSAAIPIESIPRSRIQSRPALQDIDAFQPHRAVNNGLEVGTRSELSANIRVTNRTKTPPIRTIRRYSYFDEEGSYIFGYEAEDGSFKEEKRGLDCVVHGKYGYVDPTGVLREYSYITGNQCDPNAVPVNGEIEPLPLNTQFQKLTSEKRLSHEEAQKLISEYKSRPANGRRRQPTSSRAELPRKVQQSQRRTQESPQILPQFTQQIPQAPQRIPQSSPQRTPEPLPRQQRPIDIPQRPVQIAQPSIPHFDIPQKQNRIQVSQPRLNNAPRIRKPSSQSVLPPFKSQPQITKPQRKITSRPIPTTTPRPFQPITTKRGEILQQPFIHQSFATTKRPHLSDFNFNNDFKTVFDNFKTRHQSRAQPQPRIRVTTQKPIPPPSFKAPELSPIPSIPSAPKSSHHQLVFDATSGTFKSIPIEQLAKAKQIGSLKVPAGKPLPLPNQINNSGLTHRASPLSATQINDLFSHFRIKL